MLLILAALQAIITTQCYPAGNSVQCASSSSPGVSTQPAPNVGQQMLDNMAANTRQQSAMSAQAAQSSQDRRAAAYNQVGALIAKGDCDGAKRLARFYNHLDIIKDTARACP